MSQGETSQGPAADMKELHGGFMNSDKPKELDKKIREEFLRRLATYTPEQRVLQGVAYDTGVPISLVRERVEDGKAMIERFVEETTEGQGDSFFVALPYNDPREPYYFLGVSLVAGSQLFVKPSSKEESLTQDLVSYLYGEGLERNYIQVMHANSSIPEERRFLSRIINGVGVAVVMGAAQVRVNQISYSADYSRAIVLDPEQAFPHIQTALEAPLSCLAEHNFIVVGDAAAYKNMIQAIIERYQAMPGEDILNPRTRRGRISTDILKTAADMLNQGTMHGTVKVLYPEIRGSIREQNLEEGVLVEHYSEDPRVGANPLMTSPLPLYLTGIRHVESLEQAIQDLKGAEKAIGKCMAISIYGSLPDGFDKERLRALAYERHYNKSPLEKRGIIHQGFNLVEMLKGGYRK